MTSKTPLVSVIIPTYNRETMVISAVQSVLSQSYKNFECIVIDDGSTDSSVDLLREHFGSKIVLLSQENLGVSAARNSGIKIAKGEYLAFLDSDDIWHKDKLTKQIEYLEKNKEYRICQTEEIWIRGGKRVNPKHIHKKIEGDNFLESLKRCMITPSSVLLESRLLKEVGYFDEKLLACEDYDLWLRITANHKIGLVPEKLMTRDGGREDQLSNNHSLDAYRIAALKKFMNSGDYSKDQKTLAESMYKKKCIIYGKGCIKHGRLEEGAKYL